MPKVPGSRKIGALTIFFSSLVRAGSCAIAPKIVLAREATKKKRLIFGGSPSLLSLPVSLTQFGLSAVSIRFEAGERQQNRHKAMGDLINDGNRPAFNRIPGSGFGA